MNETIDARRRIGIATAEASAIHLGLGVSSPVFAMLGGLVGTGLAAIAWSKFLTGTVGKPSRDVVVFWFGISGFFLLLTVAVHVGAGWVADVLSGLAFVAPWMARFESPHKRRAGVWLSLRRVGPASSRHVRPWSPMRTRSRRTKAHARWPRPNVQSRERESGHEPC